jgi:hypothetical protein
MDRVERMRLAGMTSKGEYEAARNHLRQLRRARKMLAVSTYEAHRIFWLGECSVQGISAVFARDRARMLRKRGW